jgi:pimeloyl-[acyl-carrier protein] synthase
LLANFGVFISAGHESTTSLIVNGMFALLTHPAELARLTDDLSLVTSAVEEMLRWVTPFQRDMRLPVVDVEIRDKHIGAGELVWCMLAAANRDPAQFPHPERFDVGRQNNHHVSFAIGPHYCLGAPLARQEAAIVVETLLRRLEGLRLAEEPITWPNDYRIRIPRRLVITFDALKPRT